MIRARLKIGEGELLDTYDGYGFVYLSSGTRFEAPEKEMEKSTYPEQPGENLLPKTVQDAFDYTVRFLVETRGSLKNANSTIAAFNKSLYDEAEGVRTYKRVEFHDDYKKVMVTGIPSTIQEPEEFWRDNSGTEHDIAVVEWKIRVDRPQDCNFNVE